jgi:hypothetical protein
VKRFTKSISQTKVYVLAVFAFFIDHLRNPVVILGWKMESHLLPESRKAYIA